MIRVFRTVVSKAKIGLRFAGNYQKRKPEDEVEIIDKDSLLQIGGEEPKKVGRTYEEYVKD